ncbi:MAG: hypothetical protein Kow0099_05350 [Candidatus Abyssubacteria bacterium]
MKPLIIFFSMLLLLASSDARSLAETVHQQWAPLFSLIPEKQRQATCTACHQTPYALTGAESLEAGRRSFEQYACYACHFLPAYASFPKFAPPLEDLPLKLADTRWLIGWLRNPQSIRPGTVMPDFPLNDREIADLVSFVLSKKSKHEYPRLDLSRASAANGQQFYIELGCVACHADQKNEESLRRRVPNLADAGTKLNPDWILQELENPKALNPDARIPKLDIAPAETTDIIAYLLTLKANANLLAAITLPQGSVENGHASVKHHGCYGCHKIPGFEQAPAPLKEARPRIALKDSAALILEWNRIYHKLQLLGTPEGTTHPTYTFSQGDIETLTSFYVGTFRIAAPDKHNYPPTDPQRTGETGERIITEYNCQGCHMFKEGHTARIDRFIGLKTYLPPRMVGEGERVQPQWLFEYLRTPKPLRIWLKMRMPDFSFSAEQAQNLVEYFSIISESPEDARLPYALPFRTEDLSPIELEMGEYRLRFDKCLQCHPPSLDETLPQDVELADLSTDLRLAKSRLRFEWIKNFLRDPDRYAGSGTRMPYVYYTPDGAPKTSDPEMWIDYLAKYLMVMEQIPQPMEESSPPETTIDWTQIEY